MATFTFGLLISVVTVFYVQVEGQVTVERQCPDSGKYILGVQIVWEKPFIDCNIF